MAKSKARLGAGNVEIELDGEQAVLRPNLKAAQTLSRQSGGIVGVIEAVGRLDVDVIVSVVTLGRGARPRRSRRRCFRPASPSLLGPSSDF